MASSLRQTCLRELRILPNAISASSRATSQRASKCISSQQRHHSTVSADEVSHFSALASSWWDPHGSSRILHLMNPIRHEFIQSCLDTAPPASTSPTADAEPTSSSSQRRYRYLDIGTGGGIFAESAARLPSTISVTAIDPTPNVIEVARAHARLDPLLSAPVKTTSIASQPTSATSPSTSTFPATETRLTYHNTSIENLPPNPHSPTGTYDIVTIFEVLEHVSSPMHFLRHALNNVAPGGWLIGSTISRTWTSWLVTNVIAEMPVFGVVPKGTHEWAKYVNPGEIRSWMKGQGWGDEGKGGRWRTMGVIYLPGVGWREVTGSEAWGNYFFAVRKNEI